MRTAALAARILLGLLFLASGASGFVLIGHPPPAPSGFAGQFQASLFGSRYVLFIDTVEALAGACLLANRYVPLALVTLAAIIANIIAFHVAMAPAGLPIAAVVTALWTLVASRYRPAFAPLLAATPPVPHDAGAPAALDTDSARAS